MMTSVLCSRLRSTLLMAPPAEPILAAESPALPSMSCLLCSPAHTSRKR